MDLQKALAHLMPLQTSETTDVELAEALNLAAELKEFSEVRVSTYRFEMQCRKDAKIAELERKLEATT